MRLFSLDRPPSPVQFGEKARRAALLLSVAAAIGLSGAHAADRADAVERPEPDPWPQEVPARADYAEAKQLMNKRNWAEAAVVLRSVHRRSPDLLPAVIDLARALVYSGRREEGLGILARASGRLSGARKAALASRARVIARQFLTQKTQQTYQDGLNLLEAQKFRLARERFEKALEAEPDNVEILVRVGQCLILEGEADSAAERLRLARRLDPFEPEIRLWLGRALHQRGELTQALEELQAAEEGLERSQRAPLWYAEALVSAGNRKAAISLLEEDAEAQPFHLPVIIALAKLRATQAAGPREGLDSLWGARRDLQVALSRLAGYGTVERGRTESELGVDMREPASEIKEEINTLLTQLDARIQSGKTGLLPLRK